MLTLCSPYRRSGYDVYQGHGSSCQCIKEILNHLLPFTFQTQTQQSLNRKPIYTLSHRNRNRPKALAHRFSRQSQQVKTRIFRSTNRKRPEATTQEPEQPKCHTSAPAPMALACTTSTTCHRATTRRHPHASAPQAIHPRTSAPTSK